MRAIIKNQLQSRKWFIIWWSIAIVFLAGINILLYPSFRDQAGQLEQSFSTLPESARSFISDTQDFFSPEGYLSSQVFYLMLPLLLSILSIVLGSSLIAREEKEGTLELLLSRPISRKKLYFSKAISGALIIILISTIGAISIAALSWQVDIGISNWNIIAATALCSLFALTVGGISFALTTVGQFGRAASAGIASLFALGGYIISSLVSAASWLETPAKAFPFYYYRPAEVLTSSFNWANLIYFLLILSVSIIAGSVFFNRRDIG